MTHIHTTDADTARLQHQLEVQSHIIEETLRQYGRSHMEITGGYVEHNFLRYDIPGAAVNGSSQLLESELAHRLGVAVTIQNHINQLSIEVSRSRPAVDLFTLLTRNHLVENRALTGVLGLNAHGKVLKLDLSEPGHVLISDPLSRGKSSLVRSLAVSLALVSRPSQLQFVSIGNPKNNSLSHPTFLPQSYLLYPIQTETNQIIETLKQIAAKLAYPSANGRSRPHIVIFWDDIDFHLERGKFELLAALKRVLAHKEDVTLIMTTRHPQNLMLTYLQRFIQTRISGEAVPRANKNNWQGAFSLSQSKHPGIQHFQAAYADPYDLSFIFKRLRENGRNRPPQILPPISNTRLNI
ncbi:MAG: hypothetical protein KDE48_21160 [Anaerolineales bacterium]|nr:hypothetical protein [Anaerolineales bacterium]